MPSEVRRYHSPARERAAAATRGHVLEAARVEFERCGWGGTTVASVARSAGVSPKTVQAHFPTKPRLLEATVDWAVRGERAEPGHEPAAAAAGTQARAIRAAADARAAVALHATMTTAVNARGAMLAAVVEAAAGGEPSVRPLWERMRESMRFGVDWAAAVVTGKPGCREELTRSEAGVVFQVAMSWGTHRTLRIERGMSPQQIEAWVLAFYARMLLA